MCCWWLSAGSSRPSELGWRSVSLSWSWSLLLSAAAPRRSGTPTLTPAPTTASSTTTPEVQPPHADTYLPLCTHTHTPPFNHFMCFYLFYRVLQGSTFNIGEFGFTVKEAEELQSILSERAGVFLSVCLKYNIKCQSLKESSLKTCVLV